MKRMSTWQISDLLAYIELSQANSAFAIATAGIRLIIFLCRDGCNSFLRSSSRYKSAEQDVKYLMQTAKKMKKGQQFSLIDIKKKAKSPAFLTRTTVVFELKKQQREWHTSSNGPVGSSTRRGTRLFMTPSKVWRSQLVQENVDGSPVSQGEVLQLGRRAGETLHNSILTTLKLGEHSPAAMSHLDFLCFSAISKQ